MADHWQHTPTRPPCFGRHWRRAGRERSRGRGMKPRWGGRSGNWVSNGSERIRHRRRGESNAASGPCRIGWGKGYGEPAWRRWKMQTGTWNRSFLKNGTNDSRYSRPAEWMLIDP